MQVDRVNCQQCANARYQSAIPVFQVGRKSLGGGGGEGARGVKKKIFFRPFDCVPSKSTASQKSRPQLHSALSETQYR